MHVTRVAVCPACCFMRGLLFTCAHAAQVEDGGARARHRDGARQQRACLGSLATPCAPASLPPAHLATRRAASLPLAAHLATSTLLTCLATCRAGYPLPTCLATSWLACTPDTCLATLGKNTSSSWAHKCLCVTACRLGITACHCVQAATPSAVSSQQKYALPCLPGGGGSLI